MSLIANRLLPSLSPSKQHWDEQTLLGSWVKCTGVHKLQYCLGERGKVGKIIPSFTCFLCLIYSPEEKVKQMEKKVNELIEESCFANDRGEFPLVRYTVLLYNKPDCIKRFSV